MNTKMILSASAVFLTCTGITLTFLPNETIQYTGTNVSKAVQLIVQMLGALYFGFAMLNWMAKGSTIGGIYNRPIAIANFAHFFIGAMALIKALINDNTLPYAVWALAIIYAVFAVLFWLIFSRNPVNNAKNNSRHVTTTQDKESAVV